MSAPFALFFSSPLLIFFALLSLAGVPARELQCDFLLGECNIKLKLDRHNIQATCLSVCSDCFNCAESDDVACAQTVDL